MAESIFVVGILFLAIVGVFMGFFAFIQGGSADGVRTILSQGEASLFYSFGTIVNPRLQPDSSNTSGSVIGAISGNGTFEIIIKFSSPEHSVPKGVVLTAATPASGIPVASLVLTVDNITSTGVDIIGSSSFAIPDGTLFYYMIL